MKSKALELFQIESHGRDLTLWSLATYESELESSSCLLYEYLPHSGFVLYRKSDDEAWISHLALREKGRGLGFAFLNDFFEHCRKQKFLSVGLEVASDNVPALKLYEKLGFERIGLRKKYYKSGADALVMRRIL